MNNMESDASFGGPTGVRLVWRESGDEISVQDSVTYVGIQDHVHTFVVPICAVWYTAIMEGYLDVCIETLPPRTQVGVFPIGAQPEQADGV